MPPRLSSTPAYTSNIELYGEVDSAGLTPRTPYSRQAANAEEGRSQRVRPVIPVNAPIAGDEDDGNLDEIDLFQTQSHPLLASSDSASFPFANRRSGTSRWTVRAWNKDRLWQRLDEWANDKFPLGLIAGTAVAVFLLVLLAISIKRPDALLNYMGVNSTAIKIDALDEESKARFNDSTVIDYSKAGYKSFPLTTAQYISECWTIRTDPRMKFATPYWTARPGAELDVLHKKPTSTPKTCSSSITYLLDGSVGLMGDLAHLALVAGFAREQNRTIFVYDDYWNRGRWTDHFISFSESQPGPEPGCAPPPPEELVACPRTARHWITSARLDFFHMGDTFEEAYEDPYKYTIERKKPVFDLSAQSFSGAIWPSVTNQKLIQRARSELSELIQLHLANHTINHVDGGYVATHIRRGDRKAMSWRYQKMPSAQMPSSEYVDVVWRMYSQLQNISNADATPSSPPLVYLATDSPSAASEFTERLTTNGSLVQKYGSETLKPVVYELRTSPDLELRSLAPQMEYVQAEWENRTQTDRIRETRGVIVDWALLSGAWMPKPNDDPAAEAAGSVEVKPAASICALPSNLCKLAAVALGWDRAFDLGAIDPGPDRRWIEIDNHGSIAPLWTAFEIFH